MYICEKIYIHAVYTLFESDIETWSGSHGGFYSTECFCKWPVKENKLNRFD